jgi:hypothetical protein
MKINNSTISNIICLLLFPYTLFSQSHEQRLDTYTKIDTFRINYSLPRFVFKIKYDTLIHEMGEYEDYILKINVYELEKEQLLQTVIATDPVQPVIDFEDINMDGYYDISLNYGYWNLSPTYHFWLYEPTLNKFVFASEFDKLHEYSLFPKLKEIESYCQETGGRGSITERYKIIDNHLILIKSIFDIENKFEKKEMIDGVLQITEQTSVDTYTDTNGDIIYIVSEKKRMYDSLYTITMTWEKDYDAKSFEGKPCKGILEKNTWSDGYRLFYKEVYNYKKLKNGKIVEYIKQYEAINNKWKIK